MIDSFSGKYTFLSNFYVEEDGTTNEHHFQMAKTDDPEWKEKILRASSPGQAKRYGRQAPLRPDWDSIKDQVMLDLVREKFTDPRLAAKLKATGDEELVEGNWWGDTYWGVCKGEGENKLGKILMQVREEIIPEDPWQGIVERP